MTTTLIAGMDIGGTKTRVMAVENGARVADETVPTDGWRTWRLDDDARNLAELVRRTCGGRTPDSFAVGAHGCDSDKQCDELQAALTTHLGGMVTVVNDSELLVPAAGYEDGIGVVAGTGSIAVARDGNGHMLAAGGWGWILGDEGSAAALVREAAKAVRGAIDNGQDDPLIHMLMAELKTTEATKLGRLLNDVRGAATWGSYAGAVFRAAQAGSPLASKVILDGGRALADLVGILVRRGANAEVVVTAGGVITEQPILLEAFQTGLASVSPASKIVLLREPPVMGAVALAERALQHSSATTQKLGSTQK